MLKLIKIAITGGVASGKTTVCQFFQELGAFVVSTDKIAHELLIPDTDLGKKIIRLLGSEVLRNEKFDRQAIAEKVFERPELLKSLEELLHPAVLCKIKGLYTKSCEAKKYTSFVVEIPLLFEIQGESFYDYIITVIADEAIAKQRFQNSKYDQRMKRQLSPKEKAEKSDYVIQNNSSIEDLKEQVVALNQTLQKP